MTPRIEICAGLAACFVQYSSTVWQYAFPIITGIGAISGCIVALHGVYMMIKEHRDDRLRRRNN